VEAISLVETLDHPHSMAHALMNALTTAVTARDGDNLRDWGGRLAALAETYNFPLQRAVAAFFFEWGKVQSGEASLDRLRSTFDALISTGPFTLLYTALLAEQLLKAGRTEEALSVIDDFVGTLKFSAGFYLPEIYRMRGECLAVLGRSDEALEQLRCAAQVATDQGSQLFRLRAALARARCCVSDDERGSAIDAVERSLAAIGPNDWPEILVAREDVARLRENGAPLNRRSTRSAGMPRGRAKSSRPRLPA
jgi:tetratricopeptide (TPR) repeat protein